MQKLTFIFLLISSISPLKGLTKDLHRETEKRPQLFLTKLSQSKIKELTRGSILIKSDLKTVYKKNSKEYANGLQEFNYFAGAVHNKSCNTALRKMSRYEDYKTFIDFIKDSKFNESSEMLYFRFDHTLLPFPISLNFKIQRIRGPGIYHYSFDNGFLKGLKGKIKVDHFSNKRNCLFQINARWKGNHTGINSLIFEMFTTTLGKLGIRKVFRISQF